MDDPKVYKYKIVEQDGYLWGYEPYFDKMVWVARINHKTKEIRPTHGYYPTHRHGIKTRQMAKDLNYKYRD